MSRAFRLVRAELEDGTMIRMTLGVLASLPWSAVVFAAPVTYTVDPAHTYVEAEVVHFRTSTVRTRIQAKSGSVTIDAAAKTGSAVIALNLDTLATGAPALDARLKGDSDFDVRAFPDATFNATRFTFDGDHVTTIAGDLLLKGRSNPVTLTATRYNCYFLPTMGGSRCGGSFEATIRRSAWGLDDSIPFVTDETKLKIEIEAIKD
jgi:polyisoprenoid-binding protein YceI